jgi:hypothetical protein
MVKVIPFQGRLSFASKVTGEGSFNHGVSNYTPNKTGSDSKIKRSFEMDMHSMDQSCMGRHKSRKLKLEILSGMLGELATNMSCT